MNYRDLIKKYIRHLWYCEGADFVDGVNRIRSESEFFSFTEEEWSELEKLVEEVKVESTSSQL